jgi:hypothetical protein
MIDAHPTFSKPSAFATTVHRYVFAVFLSEQILPEDVTRCNLNLQHSGQAAQSDQEKSPATIKHNMMTAHPYFSNPK